MIVIMLNTSYDSIYESCKIFLINENTRQLNVKGSALRVLVMISHVELIKWVGEVELI
jgi:hypothetical protein